SYAKSKSATSGEGRNCSLATITASRPFALRKARMNLASERRARPNELHLAKMMVHEKMEKINRISRTPKVSGVDWPTMSHRFTCSKSPGIAGTKLSPYLQM